ncbi:ABC transporter permease [Kribbella sp. NPDC050124]|uniref:ABC transporter permease n=1 Tax=Kribbella sp. NPDC050124 TaxID=3364114 RepID=UPI0037AE25CD
MAAPNAALPATRPGPWKSLLRHLRSDYLLYLMVVPGLLYFCVFRYAPMYGAIIAFKNYRVLDGITGSPWVGWRNFEQIFGSPYFGNILANTVLISLYKIIVGTPAAVALALLLHEVRVRWFKRAVQTITYLPHFLSWIVVFGIALVVLSPSSGLANKGLEAFGVSPIEFLSDPTWFRSVLVGSDVWKNIGWNAIVYLAALAAISPTLYEAAAVDQASRFRRVWHVSLPGILPVIVLVTTLNIGQLLSAGFEQIFVFYNPSVYSVGDIIDTWVYRQGIQGFQYSVAAAVGLFKGLVGCVLLLAANWAAKRWANSGLW